MKSLILIAEPILAQDLMLKVLPHCAKLNILRADPHLAYALKEVLDAIVKLSKREIAP